MGFLDRIRKKAKSAMDHMPAQAAMEQQAAEQQAAEQQEQAPAGPTFTWNGDTRPLPSGWDGLSMEDWFYKFETLRNRMMNIDDERGLPAMTDEDGDPLDPEEVLLITEFGFKDGGSYEAYRNWSVVNWAKQTGESPTDVEFRMGSIARNRIMAEKAGAMSGSGGALAPVEGVSCEAWAQVQAQIAGGGDAAALIANAGMDQAKWDRVSGEWTARMSSDTTGAIATIYSKGFAGAAVGQYGAAAAQAASAGIGGDVGAEPVPFETFVELSVAGRAGVLESALASKGMSPVDWSNVGMYWNRRIAQEATKYHRLFDEYMPTYELKYGIGDGLTNDQREEKILSQILDMAGSGRAAEILPFLKNYFPDDADDDDALDWWLDTACDRCGDAGDRARAQQLLPIRYQLLEDKDDPQHEWIASQMESLF